MKTRLIKVLIYYSLILSSSLTYSYALIPNFENYTFDLDANEFRAFPISTNNTHTKLAFTVECENCSLDILILNETSFNLFNTGGSYHDLFSEINVSFIENTAELTKNRLFYFIAQNPTDSKTFGIKFSYELQIRNINLVTGYTIIFLIIASNSLIIFLIIYRNNMKKGK
ncbi:MAG: hypothetical protein ACW981_00155 [Candidatus Hodarchaeales archaeon]|jgi:hypothetical protein